MEISSLGDGISVHSKLTQNLCFLYAVYILPYPQEVYKIFEKKCEIFSTHPLTNEKEYVILNYIQISPHKEYSHMKILYLGNSITLHGKAPDLGWYGEWGMAASALEKDYVHVLNHLVEEKTGEPVDFTVRNVADFERMPDTFDLSTFAPLRDEQPDVVIIRISENTPEDKVDAFGKAYLELIRYFQSERTRVYAVSAFWDHPKKGAYIQEAAATAGATYVSLTHLQSPEYQAIGQFEHPGVAAHPSDKGMAAIADAIFAAMF